MAESKEDMRNPSVISSQLLQKAMGNRWIRAQFTLIRNGWVYDEATDCFWAPKS